MPLRLTTVDAFTAKPFAGNPAAVCLLPAPRDEAWMQAVAREMNLAETAFLLRRGDDFGLRWFTPAVEVVLCGHATLASAHVLWEEGHLAPGAEARFRTNSGLLRATRRDDWITLDFPATPPVPCDPVPEIVQALGTRGVIATSRAESPGIDFVSRFFASPRGGIVRVTVVGDRVLLGGQAVTVLRAELAA